MSKRSGVQADLENRNSTSVVRTRVNKNKSESENTGQQNLLLRQDEIKDEDEDESDDDDDDDDESDDDEKGQFQTTGTSGGSSEARMTIASTSGPSNSSSSSSSSKSQSQPLGPKSLFRVLYEKNLMRQILFSRLDPSNLQSIGTLVVRAKEKKKKRPMEKEKRKLLRKQKDLWIGPHPNYNPEEFRVDGSIPTDKNTLFLNDPLFAHLRNKDPFYHPTVEISKTTQWQTAIITLLLQTCPVGRETDNSMLAYSIWKEQVRRIIVKYKMEWVVFESPWCVVTLKDGGILYITYPTWKEEKSRSETLYHLLHTSGWRHMIRDEKYHKPAHEHTIGCCRLPYFLREYIRRQLSKNGVKSIFTDVREDISCVFMNIIDLPIYSPYDLSIPTFVTALSHLNEYMNLPPFHIHGRAHSARIIADRMLLSYPSKQFLIGKMRFKIEKSAVRHAMDDVIENQNENSPEYRSRSHWIVYIHTSIHAPNSSQLVNHVPIPYYIEKVIQLLLPIPMFKSISLSHESDADLLSVMVASLFYSYTSVIPLFDTESAKMVRRDLHISTEEEQRRRQLDENNLRIVRLSESEHASILESKPKIPIDFDYYKQRKLEQSPAFYKSEYETQKLCRDLIPSAQSCTKELLTSHPECTSFCESLFTNAVHELFKHKQDNQEELSNEVGEILFANACIQIYIVYTLKCNVEVELNFSGFKATNQDMDELYNSSEAIEAFVSNIGSQSWIDKYCLPKIISTLPQAWSIPHNLMNTLLKYIKPSYDVSFLIKRSPRFGMSYTLGFKLGGRLVNRLRPFPSVQCFIDHLDDQQFYANPSALDVAKAENELLPKVVDLFVSSYERYENHSQLAHLLVNQQHTPLSRKQHAVKRIRRINLFNGYDDTNINDLNNVEIPFIFEKRISNDAKVTIKFADIHSVYSNQIEITLFGHNDFEMDNQLFSFFATLMSTDYREEEEEGGEGGEGKEQEEQEEEKKYDVPREFTGNYKYIRAYQEFECAEMFAYLLYKILEGTGWHKVQIPGNDEYAPMDLE